MTTTTATYVRTLTGYRGDARLFRLSEPTQFGYDESTSETEYVVVSAATAPFSGPETYIFPANEDGEVISWGELDGSFRGALDHSQAVRNAGWTLA